MMSCTCIHVYTMYLFISNVIHAPSHHRDLNLLHLNIYNTHTMYVHKSNILNKKATTIHMYTYMYVSELHVYMYYYSRSSIDSLNKYLYCQRRYMYIVHVHVHTCTCIPCMSSRGYVCLPFSDPTLFPVKCMYVHTFVSNSSWPTVAIRPAATLTMVLICFCAEVRSLV